MEIYVIIFLYLKKERGRIMGSVKFDYSKVIGFIKQHEIDCMQSYVDQAHKMIHEKTGLGNDFLGWLDLPVNYDKAEFDRIKKAAEKIKSDSDVLVVIGIGGSYLGARAAIEMLKNHFYNVLDNSKRKTPQVFFVGNNISSTYVADLLEVIEGKDISVNVISKSGTTTEPAIAFRIFKDYMEKKYGISMKEEEEDSGSGLSKGIQNVTENTANLLASYINAIRADVSVKREYVRRLVEELFPAYNVIAQAQLQQLTMIQINTAKNVEFVEEIRDILHRNINGVNKFNI